MAVCPIITGVDSPILRKKTKRVRSFDGELTKLICDLLETAEDAKGAGLAAPQIGFASSVCVARIHGGPDPGLGQLSILINPEVVWQSDHIVLGEEGCLSLPSVWLYVPRPSEIIIRYVDEKGRRQERKLIGWPARVAQHEIDHLNGKLITDYTAESASTPTKPL